MDIEELETIIGAMAEEGGDQIDALYDTVTLQKDTYCGFIDRLREVVRLAKKEPQGDAVALRNALSGLVKVIDEYDCNDPLWWHNGAKGVKPLKDAKEALAKPPRNCDVGNPAEQAARFNHGCFYHHTGHCSRNCERKAETFADCILKWAGRLYTEGGAS